MHSVSGALRGSFFEKSTFPLLTFQAEKSIIFLMQLLQCIVYENFFLWKRRISDGEGSVSEKANVKETLIPYIAGCIVIFGAFGIWKLVVTIMSKV